MATPGEQAETEGPQNVCQAEEEPQEHPLARPVLQRARGRRANGGHDCEFVQPPPGQTECSVCLLVLRSPHLTGCCGNNFCKECIERVQKDGKACALCNAEGFTLTYNREKDVTLKQIEVYCTHRKIGCEWKGELEMLDKHLNVDPELEKQLEGCAFAELQCWHVGCGQNFQRCLIAKHQFRECPRRPFSCEHCHEYESTYRDVATNHWPMCKCYPVSCPHKCIQNALQRQNLQKHLNEECPLQEIECEFKYSGCETKLPRKDMLEHLKENVAGHMSLLARQNQALAQAQKAVEEQIERLTKDYRQTIEERDEQIERLMREIQRGNITDMKKAGAVSAYGVEDDTCKKPAELCVSYLEASRESPDQIVFTHFEQRKQCNVDWYSEGFYTYPQGYKICLMVNAGGEKVGGTHISCFIYLMRGEFDNHLKWPFRDCVTIQLLNQRKDSRHHAKTIRYNKEEPTESNSRVFHGERASKGRGKDKFIPHFELGYTAATNCQYLMNDCLHFRVKVDPRAQ